MAIELFPNVKKFEMCDCGLSNEEMGQLREQYPNVTFVWMLHLLKYNVRTDAQAFSTLISKWVGQIDENTFAPLFQYCTELRALDLGHCDFTDISAISNLKHLIVLVISDNHVKDISALSELHDLVFLDLNCNRIRDISPILHLNKLEVLGLDSNPVKNLDKLSGLNCPNMQFVYITRIPMSEKTAGSIKKALPDDCIFYHGAGNGEAWFRREPTRTLRLKQFPRWKSIKEYRAIDDVIWYDEKPYAKDDIEQLWKIIYNE